MAGRAFTWALVGLNPNQLFWGPRVPTITRGFFLSNLESWVGWQSYKSGLSHFCKIWQEVQEWRFLFYFLISLIKWQLVRTYYLNMVTWKKIHLNVATWAHFFQKKPFCAFSSAPTPSHFFFCCHGAKICRKNKHWASPLGQGFFFSILWSRWTGDHPEEDF